MAPRMGIARVVEGSINTLLSSNPKVVLMRRVTLAVVVCISIISLLWIISDLYGQKPKEEIAAPVSQEILDKLGELKGADPKESKDMRDQIRQAIGEDKVVRPEIQKEIDSEDPISQKFIIVQEDEKDTKATYDKLDQKNYGPQPQQFPPVPAIEPERIPHQDISQVQTPRTPLPESPIIVAQNKEIDKGVIEFKLASNASGPTADGKFVVPNAEIGGSEGDVAVGEIVDLWVQPLENVPDNLYSVSYAWTVLPHKNKVVVWPDNSRIIFGTGTQSRIYSVILTASYVYVVMDEDGKIQDIAQRSATTMREIRIVGNGTNPGPIDPTDPTDPMPNTEWPGEVPEDLNGLAKLAYQWTALVHVNAAYPIDDAKATAQRLGESFQKMAEMIKSGEFEDVNEILKLTTDSNDEAMAGNQSAWMPWVVEMGNFIHSAYVGGKIRTLDEFQIAWEEIAKGLLEAAK